MFIRFVQKYLEIFLLDNPELSKASLAPPLWDEHLFISDDEEAKGGIKVSFRSWTGECLKYVLQL